MTRPEAGLDIIEHGIKLIERSHDVMRAGSL
jgi:hypothetical protein